MTEKDQQLFVQDQKPFTVYKASAGSGKTFALTFEYLRLALESPGAFRKILGVTFTNKATEEMKSRILEVLRTISEGNDHPMATMLMDSLGITRRTDLEKSARETLMQILHHYGQFAVVTIDSFFHQVIRSFAREMGLQGTFAIDLDIDKVIQEVIDMLLAEVGDVDKRELRGWLTQFASSKVEDGKAWDFRGDVTSLARELMKDHFKPYSQKVLSLGETKGFFRELLNDLHEQQRHFETKSVSICSKALQVIDSCGGIDRFSRKGSGPAGLFLKVSQKDFSISDGRRNAIGEPTKWLTKDNLKEVALYDRLTNDILPLYKELIRHIDENIEEYQSIQEVLRHFYAFGILSALNVKLQDYRDEKDVMLISDLPDFLRLIIDESDTPYIYEKIGGYFHHYLIDEFQDTSAFQWSNFKPLVKNSADAGYQSLVVGDTKQSIYRWRGGDWRLLNGNVAEDVGEHHVKFEGLDTNWRSAGQIVQFNNWFFSKLPSLSASYFGEVPDECQPVLDQALSVYDQVEQKINGSPDTGLIEFHFLEDEDWQNSAIQKTIALAEDLQEKGYQLRDMAILTRTQKEGKRVADAFMMKKVSALAKPDLKYDVVSSEALYLFSSHAVKFLISMIKWLNHEKNTIALAEWFHEYQGFVQTENREAHVIFSGIDQWKESVPQEFVGRKDHLKRLPLFELVESLIRIFKLNEIESEYTYIQGFQDAVLDYSKNERGDIPSFLVWWENVRKDRAIQVADENDAIKILTLHKSKGLEFPIVIIPFLNWKIDHDTYAKEEILWESPPDHDILERLPVVPLKYSSKMEKTFWHDAYWTEKIHSFLDNVNLLYVALTRSVSGLYAFGEVPKTSRISHVGHLTYEVISEAPEWSDAQHLYRKGKLPSGPRKKHDSSEYGLRHYCSYPWRGKVSVQMKGAAELSDQDFEAQLAGIAWHKELSRVGDLKVSDTKLSDQVRYLVMSAACRPYFENLDEVKIEVPILLPGGGYARIDRLVRKGSTWFVIDFKTGKPRNSDHKQVTYYLKLLEQMGYEQLEGRLIYLENSEVQVVA